MSKGGVMRSDWTELGWFDSKRGKLQFESSHNNNNKRGEHIC